MGFLTLSALRCLVESRLFPCPRVPLMSESEVEVDRGLGGRLDTLEAPFGGSGNAPILVVLRTVFPGVGMPDEGVGDGVVIAVP